MALSQGMARLSCACKGSAPGASTASTGKEGLSEVQSLSAKGTLISPQLAQQREIGYDPVNMLRRTSDKERKKDMLRL
jgi:hypothetical protein